MKSSIGLFYQLTVRNKTGKVVRKTPFRISKSFILQFLQVMEAQMSTDSVTMKRTDGELAGVAPNVINFKCEAAIGDLDYGILLGTGTTTPANDDYTMETLIAHGSAATQLNYAAVSFIAAQEVGVNVDFQILRSMQNLSGNIIYVTEAGLAVIAGLGEGFYLAVHDVFAAVPVANGETLTATYTFRTTV
jgi:hypothetical protein